MSNYNFFDPYITPPRTINYKKVAGIILLIALVATFVWFFINMQDKIEDLKVEKIELKQYIESDKINQQLKEVRQLKSSVDSYSEKLLLLNIVTLVDQNLNAFDNSVFDIINRTMPNDVFINNLSATQSEITINGYGENVESISLFNHRLNTEDDLAESHIKQIDGKEGHYNYLIIVVQKGDNYEAETK